MEYLHHIFNTYDQELNFELSWYVMIKSCCVLLTYPCIYNNGCMGSSVISRIVNFQHIAMVSITFTESSESAETKWSEDALSDLENSPKFVETDNFESQPKRQFKTAEIADALMGTEAPIDPSDIESLFPKNVKDFQSGFLPPCAEDDAECAATSPATDGLQLKEKSPETEQVTLKKASLQI